MKWEALDGQLNVDAAIYHIDKQNVLNLAGNITPEWRVIGGYAFVDAEVRKDSNLPSGTPLANIPRNSFSLLNVYEFQGGAAKASGWAWR